MYFGKSNTGTRRWLMNDTKARRILFIVVAVAAVSIVDVAATLPARLSVAVAEPNIQAIVRAVGGDQVDTFSPFSRGASSGKTSW
jgi:hypothetical protein